MATTRKKPVRRRKINAAQLAKEVQGRLAAKHAAQKEIESFEAKIRLKRKEANEKAMKKAFKKVGIDYDAIMGESDKRLKVQRRATERAYAKARRKVMAYIKKENRRKEVMRTRYMRAYQKDLKALEGNPELKFMVPARHWTELVRAPSGLVGGGRTTDFPSWSYSDAMSVATSTSRDYAHYFYPRARVSTGDFTDFIGVEFHQHIFLRHAALRATRRGFSCNGFRIDLSGTGHAEARNGDFCPGIADFSGDLNTTLRMDLNIHQGVAGGSLDTDLLVDYDLYRGVRSHSEPVDISEFMLRRAALFFLRGPREGGSDIMLHLTLKTFVGMSGKDGRASLDFSRRETGGIRLGCITLFGEYFD